jgi:hypothetical protein
MKKLLSLGVVGLVLLSVLAFGLLDTGAWFSDTVSSTGNQLTAATLKLSVNDTRGTVQTYMLDNIRPGDWALGGQAVVKNTGTIPGHLWYELSNVSPASGPLGGLVYPSFQANVAPWTRYGGTLVINDSVGQHVDVTDLAPGASIPLVVYFVWTPTDHDNDAQGATLTFDVIWHLEQIH